MPEMGEVARSTTPEVNVPPSVAEREEAGLRLGWEDRVGLQV